jgi:hypothetical protein
MMYILNSNKKNQPMTYTLMNNLAYRMLCCHWCALCIYWIMRSLVKFLSFSPHSNSQMCQTKNLIVSMNQHECMGKPFPFDRPSDSCKRRLNPSRHHQNHMIAPPENSHSLSLPAKYSTTDFGLWLWCKTAIIDSNSESFSISKTFFLKLSYSKLFQ